MLVERRAAFYALAPGGWRDYWTLLHPPYLVWHLAYVGLGAAVASELDGRRLAATALAFFLAVGLTAHALDELRGRPLATRIPRWQLRAIAGAALAGALGLGVLGALWVSWWLLPFVLFGAGIVLAYNLEWAGGRFHTDAWFALAWGGFPALTSAFAQTGAIEWPALLVAGGCVWLSLAQRRLSTWVRLLRRRVRRCEGRLVLTDGTEVPVTVDWLRIVPEATLEAAWIALALVAGGLVAARLL